MSNNLFAKRFFKASSKFLASASIVIGTLSPIVLNSFPALASYSYTTDIPTNAGNEIKTLFNQGITPTAIAFTPSGGWVILYNKNDAAWNNIPLDAANVLSTLKKASVTINTIAFTPSGGWVIIYNGYSAYWSSNLRPDFVSQIQDLNKKGLTINNIAFAPSGEWVIIANKGSNAYWSNNLPQSLITKINTILQNYTTHGITYTIQSVAFAPNGGWIIIYNSGSSTYAVNIPTQLANTINTELQLSNHPFIVAFTPQNGWVLEYGLIQYTPI